MVDKVTRANQNRGRRSYFWPTVQAPDRLLLQLLLMIPTNPIQLALYYYSTFNTPQRDSSEVTPALELISLQHHLLVAVAATQVLPTVTVCVVAVKRAHMRGRGGIAAVEKGAKLSEKVTAKFHAHALTLRWAGHGQ